jgi:hypothetical protein
VLNGVCVRERERERERKRERERERKRKKEKERERERKRETRRGLKVYMGEVECAWNTKGGSMTVPLTSC